MKLLKLNQEGIAHWLVPALVMAIVGVVGVRVLTATHAAAPSSVTTSNASKPVSYTHLDVYKRQPLFHLKASLIF